jgi:hypothetical protein
MITQQELDDLEEMSRTSTFVAIKMANNLLAKCVDQLRELEQRLTELEKQSDNNHPQR